jgi:hypothetical protein
MELICMADGSFNCHNDAKSQTGYCFSLGHDNGAFYARSVIQLLVALSSTEAEYIALSEATTEVIWFRQLFSDLGFPIDGPIAIQQDNKSIISIAEGNANHQRIKHNINVKYYFVIIL